MPNTGLSNKRPPYVVFVRGTKKAFSNLQEKDPNTLYYISEPSSLRGELYLGEKLISGGGGSAPTSLGDLNDILLDAHIDPGSLLVFDGEHWVNKDASEILSEIVADFKGATEEEDGKKGLVPAPTKEQKDFYLKGDGTWSKVVSEIPQEVLDRLVVQKSYEEWLEDDTVYPEGTILVWTDKTSESGPEIPDIKIADGISKTSELTYYSQEVVNKVIEEDINKLIQTKSYQEWLIEGDVIPEAGTILVYTDRKYVDGKPVPEMKIANGVDAIKDLPFFEPGGALPEITVDNENELFLVGQDEDGNLKKNTEVSIQGGTITASEFVGEINGSLKNSLFIGDIEFNGSTETRIPIYKGE